MSTRVKHLQILIAGLALVGAAQAQAPDLDTQLAQIVTDGYERPAEALAAVAKLRNEEKGNAGDLDFGEARLRVQAGELDAANALLKRLRATPGQETHAALLEALIDARSSDYAGATHAATQTLASLEHKCPATADKINSLQGCDFRSAVAALMLLAADQTRAGAHAQAGELLQRALALSEAGQDSDESVLTLSQLALNALSLDQPEAAKAWLRRVLELAEGDSRRMALARGAQATVAARTDDRSTELQTLRQALELAQQAGAQHLAAREQANLADYYLHSGEAAQAVSLTRAALPVVMRYNDQTFERLVRHNLAVGLLRVHQIDAARQQIALINAMPPTDAARRIRELRELGEAMADAGLAREAVTLYHEERTLTDDMRERERKASLEALRVKYDSTREQRDLDLLMRDRHLKDQELANGKLTEQIGVAVGFLLTLALVLGGVMLRRLQVGNRKLKANQALLRAQSERDPLTDLANRRHFQSVMTQQAQQHNGQLDGALLMVDIDHFKQINDGHGHAAGDVAICEIARRISQAVRQQDLVVRWGGEEFLVFAPGVGEEQLHGLAERILCSTGGTRVVLEAGHPAGQLNQSGELAVTVSIGYARFPLPPSHVALHWEQAVNWADMALYTAKSRGRNRAVGIAHVEAKNTAELALLEADFDAACSSQRVGLHETTGPRQG